mmetsp:Transcript_4921/g.10578  ORF Transcript_4921/g.10578 Transcript_4921/m.10578 type:complete len:201 (+) Transcript_4921:114-716(+)
MAARSPRLAPSYTSMENLASLSFCSRPSSALYSRNPFHTYLDLIHSSLALREAEPWGLVQPFWWCSPASQMRLTRSFPRAIRRPYSNSVHVSSRRERTLLTCTPRLLWTPLHSMQTTTPRFSDAQSGSRLPQSAQTGLSSSILGTSGLRIPVCGDDDTPAPLEKSPSKAEDPPEEVRRRWFSPSGPPSSSSSRIELEESA